MNVQEIMLKMSQYSLEEGLTKKPCPWGFFTPTIQNGNFSVGGMGGGFLVRFRLH